jgi:hypothetical protein
MNGGNNRFHRRCESVRRVSAGPVTEDVIMKRILLIAAATGAVLAAASPALAAQGCGPGGHRGPYGHCRPNGPREVIAPDGALVVGAYYPSHGYWDGHRYWQRRERWHGGWRYR